MPIRPLVALLAVVVLLASCGPDGSSEAAPDRSVARETVAAADHLEVWGRLVAAGVDESAEVSGDATSRAATLLTSVDARLRAHVVLVAQATEAHLHDQEDVFAATTTVVDDNREALVEALTELYDEELAEGFGDPWRLLTEHTYRYARALRAGDDGGAREAAEELRRLAGEIAEHASDMTGGLLDAGAFGEALVRIVEATTRVVREQHAQGQPWAGALHRAVETVKEPAELLTAAVAQDLRLEGEAVSDAARLRTELSAAMTGTAWFAPFLVEARHDVVEALEAQTDAVRHAFERALDPAPAADLAVAWHRHHVLLADLADALAGTGASRGQDAIEEDLAAWAAEFSRILEDTTDGVLDAGSMEREAHRHVETVTAILRVRAEQP